MQGRLSGSEKQRGETGQKVYGSSQCVPGRPGYKACDGSSCQLGEIQDHHGNTCLGRPAFKVGVSIPWAEVWNQTEMRKLAKEQHSPLSAS